MCERILVNKYIYIYIYIKLLCVLLQITGDSVAQITWNFFVWVQSDMEISLGESKWKRVGECARIIHPVCSGWWLEAVVVALN